MSDTEALARAVIKARDTYGWSPEADAAIEAMRAALAQQPAASGGLVRTLLEQHDREQLPGYRAGYEDGRQRGYTVGHRHGVEQSTAYAAPTPQQEPKP